MKMIIKAVKLHTALSLPGAVINDMTIIPGGDKHKAVKASYDPKVGLVIESKGRKFLVPSPAIQYIEYVDEQS